MRQDCDWTSSMSWKKGGSTTRVRTHNLLGPFSDPCFQVHYLIVVRRWECLWFPGFYCPPSPVHVRKRSPFLCPMLPLTREARDLQHFLQAAGDSSASPMHSNCDGRRCSLCADVRIKQGLVMRDAIHVMCTPELSSLISEGITSGGIW